MIEGKEREYPHDEIASYYEASRPVREFDEVSFDLLVRVGLLSKIDIEELWVAPTYAIEVVAYAATEVGIEFFKAVASPIALKEADNRKIRKQRKTG